MKQSLFLTIASILLFASCNKNNPSTGQNGCATNNTTSSINSQGLIDCKYLEGSYWVAIDSVNLQSDSTYINQVNAGYVSDGCNNSYEVHSFQTTSIPSFAPETYSIVPGGFFKNTSGANTGTFIYHDDSTSLSYAASETMYLDSFYVYDQYYYNVVQTTVNMDLSEGNAKSIYYTNSDFGFLRHEIYDNGTLISNRILKAKNIVR